MTEGPSQCVRLRKRNKVLHIGKKEVKLYSQMNDSQYRKTFGNLLREKILELINEFTKVTG